MSRRRSVKLPPIMKLLAAIQAGGRSTRMGVDKAWVELAERPLIEYTLRTARPLAQRLAIVISRDTPEQARYRQLAKQWQAELLFDPNDYCGPLGGIHTALLNCAVNESALILACDLPCVTAEFLTLLQTLHTAGETQSITIPLDQTGRRQMLLGFYEKTCLPAAESLLTAGKLRVDGLCTRVAVREVEFATYAHLPHATSLLNNLNTPEELHSVAFTTSPPSPASPGRPLD